MYKRVVTSVISREQMDGVGAKVRRSIGTSQLRNLDPFLMLDEFHVKKPAGFPSHMHRGFETVTYMLKGMFMHEDFAGHSGTIGPGDLQWMTAGRVTNFSSSAINYEGIVHAEMPHPDSDLNTGLQLWVNLPAKEKMCEPRYQELKAKDVPLVEPETGVRVKVIAGDSHGVKANVFTKTPILYLDINMDSNKEFKQNVPENWTTFAYIIDGKAQFHDNSSVFDSHTAIVFSKDGTTLQFKSADKPLHFVLLAGKPIGEPIEQYGPVVMNTREEIVQAFTDYEQGKNGFERAVGWSSKLDNNR